MRFILILSDWSVQGKVSDDVPAGYCSCMDQNGLTLTSNDIDDIICILNCIYIWFYDDSVDGLVVVSDSCIHHQWFAMEIQGFLNFLEVSHFALHFLLCFEQHAFHKLLANESLRILLRSFWPPATWVPSLWIPQTASRRPKLQAAIHIDIYIYIYIILIIFRNMI